MSDASKGTTAPKVKQRLDTGMFFIAFENGYLFRDENGVEYFADIRDAERAKAQIEARRARQMGED